MGAPLGSPPLSSVFCCSSLFFPFSSLVLGFFSLFPIFLSGFGFGVSGFFPISLKSSTEPLSESVGGNTQLPFFVPSSFFFCASCVSGTSVPDCTGTQITMRGKLKVHPSLVFCLMRRPRKHAPRNTVDLPDCFKSAAAAAGAAAVAAGTAAAAAAGSAAVAAGSAAAAAAGPAAHQLS